MSTLEKVSAFNQARMNQPLRQKKLDDLPRCSVIPCDPPLLGLKSIFESMLIDSRAIQCFGIRNPLPPGMHFEPTYSTKPRQPPSPRLYMGLLKVY